MKKLYSITLAACAMVHLCQAGAALEQLEEAIAQSRLSRVKTLLSKVAREKKMTDQARTKMLGNLFDTAAEVTDKRIENLSLIGNWRDTAKTLVGSIFTIGGSVLLGTSLFYSGSANTQLENFCYWGKIGGAVLVPLGSYLFYRGFTCSAQRSMIDEATEVEEYIDKVLNDAEILEGEETSDAV